MYINNKIKKTDNIKKTANSKHDNFTARNIFYTYILKRYNVKRKKNSKNIKCTSFEKTQSKNGKKQSPIFHESLIEFSRKSMKF